MFPNCKAQCELLSFISIFQLGHGTINKKHAKWQATDL